MASDTSSFKIFNYYLYNIFAEQFCFQLPVYQRAYSWETKQVQQLLDDLYTAYIKHTSDPNTDDYFLGSVVLAKSQKVDENSNTNDYDIIDGQQRLTTLFLFFIVAFNAKVKDIKKYIEQKMDKKLGIHSGLRLNARPIDRSFFNSNIARLEKINSEDEDDEGPRYRLVTGVDSLVTKTDDDLEMEMEIKYRNNTRILKEFLEKLDNITNNITDNIDKFVTFVLTKVKLIVIATESVNSAFRIFSTLNARGMELGPNDKFKAELLTRISDDFKEEFGIKWESIERELGRVKFEQMFPHLATYFRCRKVDQHPAAEDPYQFLLTECSTDVNNATKFAKEFIDFAEIYFKICTDSSKANDKRSYINYLELLRRYEYQEWISIALFVLKHVNSQNDKAIVFEALEKVVFLICINREYKNSREKRFEKYLRELFKIKHLLDQTVKDGQLDLANRIAEKLVLPKVDSLKKKEISQIKALDILYKEDLYIHPLCKEILMRLDMLRSEANQARYEVKNINIEHILPQTIKGTQWDWKSNSHKAHVHKLGNLTLLSCKKNIGAKNWLFNQKKAQYFLKDNVSTPFVTTTDLHTYTEWTREDFWHRHDALLRLFHKYFTPDIRFPTEHEKFLKKREERLAAREQTDVGNLSGTDEEEVKVKEAKKKTKSKNKTPSPKNTTAKTTGKRKRSQNDGQESTDTKKSKKAKKK
jgi:hypothetical protein